MPLFVSVYVVALYLAINGKFGAAQEITTFYNSINFLAILTGDCDAAFGSENLSFSVAYPLAPDIIDHFTRGSMGGACQSRYH
jgi:hypothetical protein